MADDLTRDLAAIGRGMEALLTLDALRALRQEATPDGVVLFHGEIDEASMRRALDAMGVREGGVVFLDFGCGGGRWLACARSMGVEEVLGVEYVADRAGVARSVLGPRATVFEGNGLDRDALWSRGPTHVVSYDSASPPDHCEGFRKKIAQTPSVRKLLTCKCRCPEGFRATQTLALKATDADGTTRRYPFHLFERWDVPLPAPTLPPGHCPSSAPMSSASA